MNGDRRLARVVSLRVAFYTGLSRMLHRDAPPHQCCRTASWLLAKLQQRNELELDKCNMSL
ncbi:hypothetical protein LOAG_07042 [Loa loa]|uniref:Uncharacterized protein n=1 Tax=Loa loa TaxID=7209 RepID=A0A1S0TWM9_LOALO|nr:hypothetical protein LOAG_07042 [Loa loa]EFO21445.2 hypothetical protein LOAG_07042 [Loa loa]